MSDTPITFSFWCETDGAVAVVHCIGARAGAEPRIHTCFAIARGAAVTAKRLTGIAEELRFRITKAFDALEAA